jgi:peptidoglycan/xylan/chitin deacetylase (PgdA/CDA1 family)
MSNGIAFLMYHELEIPGRVASQSDPGYARYVVLASAFQNQMRHLKQLGFTGVDVTQGLQFSGSQVVVTFDDGCATDREIAAPVLSEVGFRATFYITVGFLDRRGHMSTSQLKELSGRGFEIGCHSMTHPYLPDVDSARQKHEVADAKVQLEQIIGRPVEHFSCPGGRFDRNVLRHVKEAGYRTMATSHARLNSLSTDLYALGRIAVLRATSAENLVALCRGEGVRKLGLQQTARDAAKTFLGNRLYDRLRGALLGNGVE